MKSPLNPTKTLDEAIQQGYLVTRSTNRLANDFYFYCHDHGQPHVHVRSCLQYAQIWVQVPDYGYRMSAQACDEIEEVFAAYQVEKPKERARLSRHEVMFSKRIRYEDIEIVAQAIAAILAKKDALETASGALIERRLALYESARTPGGGMMGRGLSELQRSILLHLGEDGGWQKASEIAHALGRAQPSTRKYWSHAKVISSADRVILHKALGRLCARGLVEKKQRDFFGHMQTGFKITDTGLAAAFLLDTDLPLLRQRHQEAEAAKWEQTWAWHRQHSPAHLTANLLDSRDKS